MALEGLLKERFEGLLTGKKKAYELPEFQGMQKILESAGAKSRAGAARTMRTQGIAGPSVGMTLQKKEEQELAPMGQAMGSMLAGIPRAAEKWGTQQRGLGIQEELGRGQLRETRKARKLAERGQKWSMAGDIAGMACILTTACYGEDSSTVAVMRYLRDRMGNDPTMRKIIRGYYVFSDLIMPVMKFNFITSVVKHALIDPLLRMILRRFGFSAKPWMTPIDQSVSFLALYLWKMMGSRGIYTRKNGEKV